MTQSIKNLVRRDQKGFTLIELLVVIAIIAILAALILVALNAAQRGSRDSRRQSDINQYKTALANYFSSNGNYPTGTNVTIDDSNDSPCLQSAGTGIVPNYLSTCLTGPNNSQPFFYNSDGNTFTICARSERNDRQAFAAGPSTTTTLSHSGQFTAQQCTGVS